MKMPRSILLIVLFLLFCAALPAQETPSPTESKTEKEKAQKELEKQVLKIARSSCRRRRNAQISHEPGDCLCDCGRFVLEV